MTPGTGGEAAPAKPAYYPLFDFLRIILTVGVFLSHAHFLSQWIYLPKLGDFCVRVFFALSGFLIGGILRGSKTEDLPRFYFNRSTRIWIPYFLAILLLGVACALKRQPDQSKYLEFFTDKVTFTYNWFGATQLDKIAQMPLGGTGSHFWSICIEEQFYLVAPLIIVLLGRYSVVGIVIAGGLATWRRPLDFAGITIGVLIALSEGTYGKWYRRQDALAVFTVALALTPALTVFWQVPYMVTAPLASISIVLLCSGSGPSTKIGTFLGGISYPFYLNHWVGLFTIKRMTVLLHSANAAILFGLFVSLAFAAGHYLLVDRPVHKYRVGWFTRARGLACAAAGFLLVVAGVVLNFVFWRPGR